MGGAGVFDNFFQGLPLTPPGIEVLDGREWLALWSDAKQLPYQAVMKPVNMLSMVQLREDLRA
jgi:hypothetical protein